MIVAFVCGGLIGISLLATPEDDIYYRPVLLVIGKSISTIFWLGCSLHSPEIFPTSTRTVAFCVLDCCSKVGATLAPFLVDLLSTIDDTLPNTVIGIMTLIASFTFFFLPETMDEDIPETVEDMAKMKDILAKKMCKKS